MATVKVNCTKDYRLFERSADNRPVDVTKHKRLRESLKQYGWLRSQPMAYSRNGSKRLIVKDGQHRLAIAEELGIPVWWVEEVVDFDIGRLNGTTVIWKPRDHAEKYAAQGNKHYAEGIALQDEYGLTTITAFTLLGGTVTFANIVDKFYTGEFKVVDREWAQAVASTYKAICALSRPVHNARFLEAIMAVCRCEGFNQERLLSSCTFCREKLVAYATRDAYLDMIEDIYNFHKKTLVPIKMQAIEAMRRRNAVAKHKAKKEVKQ